ncbi:MAG: segregation/condensation protein A [Lachnospiraceae bacterium]|nr:segregation/condensation protein A [Lachnospiraceae bacterium]
MDLAVKLDNFEGPLDLLLHLIDKNKINIYDIPIVLITEQYMAYVEAMPEDDLDLLSEFLVMAATLLEIKARMLLPAPEDEEEEPGDPRAELVERLLEYRKFKYISTELRDLEAGSEQYCDRGPTLPEEVAHYRPPLDLDEYLQGLSLPKLKNILEEMLRRQEDRIDTRHSHFGEIEREAVQMGDRLDYVRERVTRPGRHSFRSLLQDAGSRMEVIVTFLAVLELVHAGDIRLTEDSTRDDFVLEDNTGRGEEETAPAPPAEGYEPIPPERLPKRRRKKVMSES